MTHWLVAFPQRVAFWYLVATPGTANLSREGFQLIVRDLVNVIVPVSDVLPVQLLSLP